MKWTCSRSGLHLQFFRVKQQQHCRHNIDEVPYLGREMHLDEGVERHRQDCECQGRRSVLAAEGNKGSEGEHAAADDAQQGVVVVPGDRQGADEEHEGTDIDESQGHCRLNGA